MPQGIDHRARRSIAPNGGNPAFLAAQFSNVSLPAIGPLAERFGLNPPLYVCLSFTWAVLAMFWFAAARKGMRNVFRGDGFGLLSGPRYATHGNTG